MALTTVAVEALRRELAQADKQREQDRTALEQERQTIACLRAELERVSVEQAGDSERLRAALDEERECLRKDLTCVAEESVRTALDEQRQRLYAEFAAEKERLSLEAATAEDERRRTAIREERRLANEREGALYLVVNRLRFERAGAEDQKRVAESANAKLLAERDELRDQLHQTTERCQLLVERDEWSSRKREYLEERCDRLVESGAAARRELNHVIQQCKLLTDGQTEVRQKLAQATEQCKRLTDNETVALKKLAETKRRSLRRKRQLLAARKQIGLLEDNYEDLEIEHNTLAGRLIGEYRGLLAAKEQQWVQWANQQCEGWAAQNARLRSECYALQGHNARLQLNCQVLQGDVEHDTDTVARLRAMVMNQRRQIKQIEKQFEAHLSLSASSTTPAKKTKRRELPPESTEPRRNQRRELRAAPRQEESSWSDVFKAAGLVAGGAATGLLIGESISNRRQKVLPVSSQPVASRLEGRTSSHPTLPPKR